ncbi:MULTISPECIES: carbamoyl-phosphate synthase domain-containing protein [Corynebacterium]|uniref:Carbamoyl-phosphate synthase small subunit N-terminal domain-containing protein n=1 Tax=Corynebacterium coyleae TaxID=53374 RepID=A0AAP6XJN4_9CORY|nr:MULTISPECIES: carbamoyl-phosphate synthase domain-containing protein [Corynebacterium]MDK6492565.1 carbamoyl-phosphate synthase domain-containing protein [Corynebacterium coyleae]MDK8663009.1 carbamoyl-phosphate synthase domain-containing protein [Corynebacterium coyleae]MDK8705945.1 carbamoyl-phosphate synthase domain-containing protein [Corynebacterium coyleae]MDK8732968.1 carbamoyl-phosphate synthase domain-containing protein [Corynebacterium coyleae]MDK8891986.1 carbamoyl-phosphate synt
MTQTQQQRTRAQLVLDTGEKFTGFVFGAAPEGDIEGDLKSIIDMFGYEREMCSADNDGKILVFATPHIGNVGWTGEGAGEGRTAITAKAVVIRDLARIASNQEAKHSLEEEMKAQGITGIWGVDTRRLVRHVSQAQHEGKSVRVQVIVEKQEA